MKHYNKPELLGSFARGSIHSAPTESSSGHQPMNRDRLLELHKTVCTAAYELMKRKNADYSGGASGVNPFLNFTRCENMGICTTERGFLVRLTDKMSRLSTFCDTGTFQVADEKLHDTIQDIINYSVLFLAYSTSKADGRDSVSPSLE
jgi:hypothetical protein